MNDLVLASLAGNQLAIDTYIQLRKDLEFANKELTDAASLVTMLCDKLNQKEWTQKVELYPSEFERLYTMAALMRNPSDIISINVTHTHSGRMVIVAVGDREVDITQYSGETH